MPLQTGALDLQRQSGALTATVFVQLFEPPQPLTLRLTV
jgi:hypothetical protein